MTQQQWNTKNVWKLFKQFHLLRQLSQSPLLNNQLARQLIWEGDDPILHAYSLQGVLLWAIAQLQNGHQFEQQSAAILEARYIEQLTVHACAIKLHLSERGVNSRRSKAIERIVSLLNNVEDTEDGQQERLRFATAARYAACTADAQWWLKFFATFQKPITLEITRYLGSDTADQSLGELRELNWIHQLADGRVQVHPYGLEFARQQQDSEEQRTHHSIAAAYYRQQEAYPDAIYHLQKAYQDKVAAQLFITHYQRISAKMLQHLLETFKKERLSDTAWAELQLIAGQIMAAVKNLDSAIEAFEQALQAPDPFIRAQACYGLAKLYESRNVLWALRYYQRSKEWLIRCEGESAQQLQVQVLLDEAWVFINQQRDFERAEANLADAAQLLQPSWDTLRIVFHTIWAELYYNQGNISGCIEERWQAWFIANETQNREEMIKTAYNLAYNLAHDEQMDEACRMMEKAQKFAQETGDQRMVAHCQQAFGAFCILGKKDARAALPFYHKAYDYFRSVDNKHRLAIVCHDLVEAYAILGRVEQAQTFLRERQTVAQALYSQYLAAIFHILEQIKRFFCEGLEIAKALNDQRLNTVFQQLTYAYPFLTEGLTKRQQAIVWHVWLTGNIRTKLCKALFDLSRSQAQRDLLTLCQLNILQKVGQKSGTHYILYPRT